MALMLKEMVLLPKVIIVMQKVKAQIPLEHMEHMLKVIRP